MYTYPGKQHIHAVLAIASAVGIAFLIGGTPGSAQESLMEPPSAHHGVGVARLGMVPEDSLERQIGLSGHYLQLREITLEPGGVIARHDHANRPGLAWTMEGSWTEVRRGHPGIDGGAREYPAGNGRAIVEDAATDHWFRNSGTEPVRVVVCDIMPTR